MFWSNFKRVKNLPTEVDHVVPREKATFEARLESRFCFVVLTLPCSEKADFLLQLSGTNHTFLCLLVVTNVNDMAYEQKSNNTLTRFFAVLPQVVCIYNKLTLLSLDGDFVVICFFLVYFPAIIKTNK